MELFLVPALVVWSARGNTGLPGKKLHLRILLGMRIGFKRNNHHKCLLSQIQLILQADFLYTAALAGLTLLSKEVPVLVSKVQWKGCSRAWPLLALAKTEERPWKTCPMENACSYSSGPCSGAQQHQSHTARLCSQGQEELCAALNSSEKREPKPEPRQMVPFPQLMTNKYFQVRNNQTFVF